MSVKSIRLYPKTTETLFEILYPMSTEVTLTVALVALILLKSSFNESPKELPKIS